MLNSSNDAAVPPATDNSKAGLKRGERLRENGGGHDRDNM